MTPVREPQIIGLPPAAPMDMPTQVLERSQDDQDPASVEGLLQSVMQALMMRLFPRHA